MRREHLRLHSHRSGAAGGLIAYGQHGRPVLAFPPEQGDCWDYEEQSMIDGIGWLIDDGRVKLFCVDSEGGMSWFDNRVDRRDRRRRRARYEDWITHEVVDWIFRDRGGRQDIIATGVSRGASHAAFLALRRADLFPLAICHSGAYDPSAPGSGNHGDAAVSGPMEYLAQLHEDQLAGLRSRVRLVLVCGQWRWEDAAGSRASTNRFAKLLADKGVQFEIDLWGYDVPDDWPSWRTQIAHHLPRFV